MHTRQRTRSVVEKAAIAGTFILSGASINNEGSTTIPPPSQGVNLPPRASPPADESQVTDFPQDVQVGLLGVLPLNPEVQ